ncbi:hypothetical protein PybrP1_008634 [[Pythium] brassicae (nom. inval.)]|nr:hypothetical protein PybrP1_008634 [[Pythium] brassicae (nom. inval.)]
MGLALLGSKRDIRGHYALLNEIGRGGFSVVRLAVDTQTEELLAAKVFDPKCSSAQDIQDEIATLRHLGKHRNIVSLHDVLYAPNETIMFTDLVQGGELFDYIVDMGSVSEKDASRLLHDTCRALEYMHSRGICHRDLKPENVLLTNQSPAADIKIADFGLSRRLRSGEKVLEDHPNGTVAYWSPEIIKRQPQDFGVDMWAFGVLAYITLVGVHPFDPNGDRTDAEIVREIAKGTYDVTNPWYGDLSDEAKDFLARLLSPDPSARLSASEALAHSWLKGKTSSTEPLRDGHADRLLAYQRLQHLRANILAVVMSTQHTKFETSAVSEKRGGGPVARVTTVNMDMFKDTFALFDKDESGDIDRAELEGVMVALGQRLSQYDCMGEADIDGNGKISFMEFVSVMNQRLFRKGELTEADLKSAFNIYDTNHDGFISSSELEYMLHLLGKRKFSRHEIASMIEAADSNADGKIDYAEFCQLMQKSFAGTPGAATGTSGDKRF